MDPTGTLGRDGVEVLIKNVAKYLNTPVKVIYEMHRPGVRSIKGRRP